MSDGKKIIASLYNDRDLLSDNAKPLPLETLHRNRPRGVHTVFGRIELRSNYHHHAKSGTGRCPLDDLLGLYGTFSPAVANVLCRQPGRLLSGSRSRPSRLASAAALEGLQSIARRNAKLVQNCDGMKLGEFAKDGALEVWREGTDSLCSSGGV